MNANEALIKFLLDQGLLSAPPDPALLSSQPDFPIAALTRLGLLDQQAAFTALRKSLGTDFIDLHSEKVRAGLQLEEFKGLKPKICWQYRVIPLYQDNETATVAFANPFDREALKTLEFVLGKAVRAFVAEEAEIVELLTHHFPQQQLEYNPKDEYESDSEVEVTGILQRVEDLDRVETDAAPIVRLANKILADAVKLDASDIHLEPNESNLAVRFRIDGVLQNIITVPRTIQRNLIGRLKVLGNMDIAERRRPQDGRMRVIIGGKPVDLRISTIPASSGEKVVLRILRADYENLSFGQLGMPGDIQPRFEAALNKRGKLLLVTGPTGSGKTTTLYVSLSYLHDGKTNITTIEDPIEYKFEYLNQIQTNEAAGVGFASVLRAVLRQDPDIVMIGEIRDTETLKIVLQAAQTGHLVLSTVHTNDAPSVISRLLDLGADPYGLSATLLGVMAQRLVRKICDKCKEALPESDALPHLALFERYGIDPRKVMRGRGCVDCFYSGYRGRTGIYSYLEINEAVAEAIYRGAHQEEIAKAAQKYGFCDLDEGAAALLNQGLTTVEEILPYLKHGPRARDEHSESGETSAPEKSSSGVHELRITLDAGGAVIPQSFPGGQVRPGGAREEQSETIAKPRVLVIDDNKSVRRMITTLLRREMVDVDEAQNGVEALAKVYEQLPNLIVCDIQMPEMNGREFLEKLKSNRKTRDIPVIMLTVDDSEVNEAELLTKGAIEFLSKRSSPVVLATRIRRILGTL